MFMVSTIVKKQELIDWIEELEDQTLINDLCVIKEEHSSSLKWDDLPCQVKKDIREGQAQAKAGEGLTSKEMWEEINKRRKERA